MKEEKNRNKGSLTVETLLFLIPFMLAFCTIINVARFVQAEMIVHHAITQTAKEISAYGYVLTRTGITERMQATNKKSSDFTTEVNEAVASVEKFVNSMGSGDGSAIYTNGQEAWEKVDAIASDPSSVVSGVISLVKSNCSQAVLVGVSGSLAKGSIKKQLSLMSDDPNAYLERIGIVGGLNGLDFSKSEWNSNQEGKGNIKIVVTFKMKNKMFPMFDFGEQEYVLSASTLVW